jgi:predicted dehydrogenase
MEIRIGVIGIGGLGYLQTKSYSRADNVTIVGGADIAEDARQLFEREFDAPAYEHYRELLHNHGNELDAVTIITPHALHYEHTKACLHEGLHVLIEKPMVTDIDHAVDLVETASERGVVLLVGYQRHFHPAFREIRRIIDSGRIGELHMANCYLGQEWVGLHRGAWRMNPTLSGGGQLYDTGSHLLDALLWTSGSTPVEVGAQITFEEPGVDVNSALSIELDRDGNTVTASVGISGDGVDNHPSEGYFYWGTEGRLAYTDGELVVAEQDGMTYRTEITGGTDFQTLNELKLDNFIAAIEGLEAPAVPGEVGLQVTALTEAAYQAAETSSVVSVQPLIDEAYANRA